MAMEDLHQPVLDSLSRSVGADPETASITPPNSADGKKINHPEGVPSDLSDLELDANSAAADIGEVEPDHYYGGGKIPVFKPTMEQFQDFAAFCRKIDKYGMKSGVVKIIPPKEWTDSLPSHDNAVKSIRVKNPIMQEFHGSHGMYTQANIEKQRSYNLPQWKALCEESSHQPPARRGERRRNQERMTRTNATTKSQPDSKRKNTSGRGKRADTEPEKVKEEPVENEGIERSKPEGPPTPVSPESKPIEPKQEELSEGESLPAPKPRGRQPKSVTQRRKYNRGDASDYFDEEAFKGFDYRIHDNAEYTSERCDELETAYWKSLMYNNPMYGADMPGSLFTESTTSWNVAKLPNLLDVLGQKVPGVNTAYLYLGMWKATFAWHLEDVDLYSINYIHFGAPKQWYSISQEDAPKFEAAMKSIWPTDAKNCDQFLRHKTYLISPSLLKSQYGITVNKLVHYEGEFVITFPYGYHSGYNLGYNCAESVNFATEKWLDYGRVAKKCNCEADSVWIDVDEIERKLRGETTPEYFDDMESDIMDVDGASDLLTPPRSVPEKTSTRGRKRKREGETPRQKRWRLHTDTPRKIPCVLCPNNLDYEPLLPTEDGKSHAHRRCAEYIEETTILKDDSGNEVVCDIDKIPKARFGLKCLFCREVRGACFQCTYGKCTRAYHATCAILASVQVECGEIAVAADDGHEYSVPAVDLKCKYHRQKRSGYNPNFALDTDPSIKKKMSLKRPGDLVQFQVDKEINGAIILENREQERTVVVKVLPRGDVVEVNYRWFLVVSKSSFPPLAPGTQRLPRHLARKPETRKDLTALAPMPGSAFTDSSSLYQWAEFDSIELPFGLPTKADLSRPDKMWYYLGKSSTECRAQYTDNPRVEIHNPRSNFLDNVKSINAFNSATYRYPTVHPPHRAAVNPLLTQRPTIPAQRPTNKVMAPPAPRPKPALSAPVNSHTKTSDELVARQNSPQWQDMLARRRAASITEHANQTAEYKIVSPQEVVEALFGAVGSVPPHDGIERLERVMSQLKVQPKAAPGGEPLPPQPLNLQAEEVVQLLKLLRFVIVSHRENWEAKRPQNKKEAPRPQIKSPPRYTYLELQRRLRPTVYQSPYAPRHGFTEYAIEEYKLSGPAPPKESLANDYFASLSREDQDKIMQACGGFVKPAEGPVIVTTFDGAFNESNPVFGPHLPHLEGPVLTAKTLEEQQMSLLDIPLHADSPASNFSRAHVQYQTPNDYPHSANDDSSLMPRHMQDHHDLFGDQQANQRFWQHGNPWSSVAGDGNTPDDENARIVFGPHERLKHEYASSDMDLGRGGPGSLHSVDMAGFGLDTPEELYPAGLSP